MTNRRMHSAEFKRDAVQLARTSGTLSGTARDLGLTGQTGRPSQSRAKHPASVQRQSHDPAADVETNRRKTSDLSSLKTDGTQPIA